MNLKKFYRILFKIGLQGFGGGLALIGLLHRDLVKKEKMISEKDFSDGVAVSQLLPGPIITDLVAFLGALLGGVKTAVFGLLFFILPSFVIMLLISLAYFQLKRFSVFPEIMAALRPVVVGLIAATLWQLAKTNLLRGPRRKWLIFIVCSILLLVFKIDFFILIILAGLAGWLLKPAET